MSPKSITINRSILKKQDCNSKTLFTQVTKMHRICNCETSTYVSDSFEPTFSYKKLLIQFPINIPIHFNAFQYATAFSRILDPLDAARKFNVLRRSEYVQGIFWMSYIHSNYVLCPEGGGLKKNGDISSE